MLLLSGWYFNGKVLFLGIVNVLWIVVFLILNVVIFVGVVNKIDILFGFVREGVNNCDNL